MKPAPSRSSLLVAMVLFAAQPGPVAAQSLDDLLDEHDFVKGISDLAQPGALEEYLAAHPPTKPADDLRYRLAAAKAQLDESTADSAHRQALLDAVLRLRRQLIDQNPGHPRRAIWLTDQAADLYFVQLALDGRGLISLYGLPSEEQRRAAAQTATEMDRLMVEAERGIERTLAAVEAISGFQQSAALQDRRRELDLSERQRRIPFLRGIAACLDSELRPGVDAARRRRGYMLAVNTLKPVCGELDGTLAAQARACAGLALARLGRAAEADDLFRTVLADAGSTSSDRVAARMAGIINQATQKGPAAALLVLNEIEIHDGSASDLFYRLIVVDQRFHLRRQLALLLAPGPQRDQALAGALGAYVEMLAPQQRSGGAPVGTPMDMRALRESVVARLMIASQGNLPLELLPPLAAVARAKSLSRDASTRLQAIALLESVVRGSEADEATRAIGLLTLGEARWAAGEPLLAARAFLDLARGHATDPEAARAVELAATIAAAQYARQPPDADARPLLSESLTLLLDGHSGLQGVDRWRLLAGELALAEGRNEEAAVLFDAVAPASDQWADAQVMRCASARIPLAQLFGGPVAAPDIARVLALIQRVRPELEQRLSRSANPDEARRLRGLAARLTTFEAEARIAERHPELAVALLEAVQPQTELSATVLGEARQASLAAAAASGRKDEVVRCLHGLLDSAPDYFAPAVEPLLTTRSASLESQAESGSRGDSFSQAQAELASIARVADDWLGAAAGEAARRATESTALRRALAGAFRRAGQWEAALGHYEWLLQRTPNDLDLLYGRAECLNGLGGEQRLGEAMAIYKRLVAASAEARDLYFWRSQLRTLQILDQLGRNTHQIAPQIRRLRQLDAQLGGPQLRPLFDALQNKHG